MAGSKEDPRIVFNSKIVSLATKQYKFIEHIQSRLELRSHPRFHQDTNIKYGLLLGYSW